MLIKENYTNKNFFGGKSFIPRGDGKEMPILTTFKDPLFFEGRTEY